MKSVSIGKITFGGEAPVFIGGPCVIESEEHCLKIAGELKRITSELGMPFIFKASFDKANRSSIRSYRGPGLEAGLRVLDAVKRKYSLPILTDIHEPAQAAPAAEVADVLQIPAFLCRQTDLLVAAAKTGKAVNVKKGQFLSPGEMKNIVGKLNESGTDKIILTERGTFFGYNRLVNDFCAVPQMRALGYPVVFDATHSVQSPGGGGAVTTGNREMIPYLARAAAAVGIDGLFMETHDNPDAGMSDAANMYPLSQLRDLLAAIIKIHAIARGDK